MARHRKIDPKVWGDAVFRNLSPDEKLLWLFLLTGPHYGVFPGLFELSSAVVAEKIGCSVESAEATLAKLETAKKTGLPMLQRDKEARVMFLPAAMRYNQPESPNVALAWARSTHEIPECQLVTEALNAAAAFLQSVGEAYADAFRRGLAAPLTKSADPEPAAAAADARPNKNPTARPSKSHAIAETIWLQRQKIYVLARTGITQITEELVHLVGDEAAPVVVRLARAGALSRWREMSTDALERIYQRDIANAMTESAPGGAK
jgi:hypothetical protein